jgi:phosphatidylglycerol:prolipoprotein diacylglycerol transferase
VLPVVRLGPVAIQAPALVILVGFWLSLELAGQEARRRGLNRNAVLNAGLLGVAVGIVAARAGYVIQSWPAYRDNLLGVLSPTAQALSLWPGLLVGLVAAGGYLAYRQVLERPLLDALAPGLAALLVSVALANSLAGTAYGVESSVPWAMELWGVPRQPVQLFEAVAALLSLGLLLALRGKEPAPGLGFLLFVALYGATRVALEPLRAQSAVLAGGWRTAQVAGLLAMGLALWQMSVWYRVAQPEEGASRDPIPPRVETNDVEYPG